jgi:phosphomannomutase
VKSHFIEQGAAADEFDGLTIEFPDRWFNIRASNTEPLLRVNVEGDTPEAMETLRDDVLRVIGI